MTTQEFLKDVFSRKEITRCIEIETTDINVDVTDMQGIYDAEYNKVSNERYNAVMHSDDFEGCFWVRESKDYFSFGKIN
jgi:hypothetical protein